MGAHRRTHYLVDGYNLAHALKGGPMRPDELLAARESLVRLLRVLTNRRTAVTIVFDSRTVASGTTTLGRSGVVEVVYARDADAAIVDSVRRSAAPETIVVVSRDRAVAGRAAQLGARTLSVEALLERIERSGAGGPEPGEPPEKYG